MMFHKVDSLAWEREGLLGVGGGSGCGERERERECVCVCVFPPRLCTSGTYLQAKRRRG